MNGLDKRSAYLATLTGGFFVAFGVILAVLLDNQDYKTGFYEGKGSRPSVIRVDKFGTDETFVEHSDMPNHYIPLADYWKIISDENKRNLIEKRFNRKCLFLKGKSSHSFSSLVRNCRMNFSLASTFFISFIV